MSQALAGPPAIDMTGHQVAHWTVLRQTWSRRSRAQWRCRCECGSQMTIAGTTLRAMKRRGAVACQACGRGDGARPPAAV